MTSPSLTDLLADAKLALETIEQGKSPVFRKAAAEWLQSIAKQLAASVTDLSTDH